MTGVNRRGALAPRLQGVDVALHDETLRDGLQSPSVTDPSIDDKIAVVRMLDALGIGSVNVGLPGAGPRARADAIRLCREIVRHGLRIRPTCAGRTVVADLAPIVEAAQEGVAVEAMTFIGSSPIRCYVERWSLALIRRRSVEAIEFAVAHDVPVTYVTEDTTRSRPEVLAELFAAAIGAGASRLCLCDTTGHATPDGARNLVEFTAEIIDRAGVSVGIDWHGHNDRGLGLANALAAAEAGVGRVHGCVLGIGERVGNVPLEMLMINLADDALPPARAAALRQLCAAVARATDTPIPRGHVLFEPSEAVA